MQTPFQDQGLKDKGDWVRIRLERFRAFEEPWMHLESSGGRWQPQALWVTQTARLKQSVSSRESRWMPPTVRTLKLCAQSLERCTHGSRLIQQWKVTESSLYVRPGY